MRLHLDDVRFYRSQRRADDCQLRLQFPFKIFPDLIKNVFAENCVAVVFIVAMVLNIILPKEEEE